MKVILKFKSVLSFSLKSMAPKAPSLCSVQYDTGVGASLYKLISLI